MELDELLALPDEELVSVSEVAFALNRHRQTIRRYIYEGHLKFRQLVPGGDYEIFVGSVRLLLEQSSDR